MGSIHIVLMIYMELTKLLDDYLRITACSICGNIETTTKKCFSCKENYPYKRTLRHLVYYNKITEKDLIESLKFVDVVCCSCLTTKKTFPPKHDKKQYAEAKKQHRQELITWFRTLRSSGACALCNKSASDGTFKEFHYHHIDPSTKICEVSYMVQQCNSKDKIINEIEKCILVCNKCHFKLHAKI
jgi:hypothetical protein